ncbi:hypothetical protein HYPSUDRAFT_35906 [Hypholoma sublateritium FD-334 SS-4]|uniref:Uncharacterized protein n=1 Tax=Hypholoma sublateritium (strain FD-334 SS-4) TaxID=945553 RepID=A0A0D2PDY8_HYPSF|nr:hypothetical protein HYPSUDRAFT_35906 [Hypholoma sublateritium FD-334 SS-4]
MSEHSTTALLELAKKQLGLRASTSDSRVPDFYLEELRTHLKLFPLEDNFRVALQPKFGSGIVTCLKNGCNQRIHLTPRVKCEDGGRTDGTVSLSAYRTHLSSHLLQETSVRTRSGKTLNASSSSTKIDNLLPSSEQPRATRLVSSSRPKAKAALKATPASVKPEPIESVVPRKRLSDQAFPPVKTEEGDKNVASAVPSKRVKTETDPKEPLAQVTNVPVTPTTSRESVPMYSGFDGIPGAGAKLEDVQAATSDLQYVPGGHTLVPGPVNMNYPIPGYADVYQNWAPTYDQAFNAVGQYQAPKEEYRQFSPVPPPFVAPMAPRKSHNVPRPFPMDFDQVKQSSPEFDNLSHLSHQAVSLPVRQYNWQSHPSSSTPPRDNKLDVFVDRDVKPYISGPAIKTYTPTNAMASSSREVTLPLHVHHEQKPRFPGAYMDVSDDDQDSNSGFENAHFQPLDHSHLQHLDHFVDRIGINVPPPIDNDDHDDNGDYHGRGHDMFVGPQAVSDDIEKFLVEAGNAENFDGNETVDKALAYLELRHLDEKLPGMDISLMAHQVMGVAWMLEKEKSGIRGGCLADEMGLGKTVQMIAVMVKNRSTNPSCKTNLIVAPLALLDQWKLEIEEKTNCGLSCLIYHGQSRTRKKSDLTKHDVVLTTFNTMAMEWPDYENELKKKDKAKKARKRNHDDFIVEDSDDNKLRNAHYRADKRKQHVGLLFQVEFYRIVADEGQQIRNRRTRMSRSITDLQATYRWVLTGTPIVNSLSDVYGYIRFLKVRPWYDWSEFHGEIGKLEKKRPGVAVARLQKVMTLFLLRRKKDSQLDGKKLIELPPKEVVLLRLEFSEEEREIYYMIEARSQAKFNRYLRAGTVLKNYHQVLVLLLRLRQICSHPSLIQEDGVAFVHPDEAHVKPEFATELTRARRIVSPEFVAKMKEKFKQQALARMEVERKSANATIEEEDCPICFDAMTDAVITPCTHIFCRDCIVDVLNQAPPMDAEDQVPGGSAKDRPCPVCRAAINAEKLFSREAFEYSDEDLNDKGSADMDILSDSPGITSKGKGRGKSKVMKKSKKVSRVSRRESDDEGDDGSDNDLEYDDDDGSDLSDFIVESDEDEEEKDARRAMKQRQTKKHKNVILDSDDEPDTPEEQEVIFGLKKKVPMTTDVVPIMSRFLPSSKMKFMMDQLQKLKQTNPEEKTLVVSQWTGCLTLVSDYLTENGIPHVKYQGDMNRPKRDQAVQVFMSKEKARVMLMSLKCGGVGLNLTRANNVISLDLGWSQAVEAQAYDRVHRLGQTRKVTVQRIVIADTVEDRILALQERKQALADGSLGEGNGQKIGKLSVKELANLFGLDARGRRLTNG